MFRLVGVFAAITFLEVLVGLALGAPPSQRPGWYDSAMSAIAILMCVGGVESARWLLRRSPAAAAPGPVSDWTRLWLWTGIPGGALLTGGLLLSWLLSGALPPKVSLLLLGHFVTGSLIWIGAAFWAVPDLLKTRIASPLPRQMMFAGLGLHGLGTAIYLWGYPALLRGPWKVDLGLLFSMISHYYFIFYYVLVAGLFWGLVFRTWQPPVAAPAEPEPEEPLPPGAEGIAIQ